MPLLPRSAWRNSKSQNRPIVPPRATISFLVAPSTPLVRRDAPPGDYMADPRGVVVPGAKVLGWPATGTKAPTKHNLKTFKDALNGRYDYDAWFQPCLLVEAGEKKQYRLRKAAADQASTALTCVFLDFDLPGHREWRSVLEETSRCKELFDSTQRARLPKPAIYSTNHGARLAWPLAEPVDGRYADDFLSKFRDWCKAQGVGDDQGALEWDDAAIGWTRAYRLPHVQRDSGYWAPNYSKLTVVGPLEWRPNDGLVLGHARKDRPVHETAPDLRPLTPAEWLHIAPKHRTALEAGQAHYERGGRNTQTLNKLLPDVSSSIAEYAAPNPEIVYLALAPGVIAQGEEPTLERLWERTVVICENDAEDYSLLAVVGYTPQAVVYKAIDDYESAKKKLAVIRAEMAGQDQARVDMAYASLSDKLAKAKDRMDREIAKMDQARLAQSRDDKTNASVQIATANANKPLLVYAGAKASSYMLYQDGRYHEKAKDVISTLLEREHSLQLRSGKGGLLKFSDAFDRMGSDAHSVHTRYWLPGREEYFDPLTRVLHLVTRPPGFTLEPKFHADVAHWLSLLVPDKKQNVLLLDWLGAALKLEDPIAALFLVGESRIGKSMLGEALASLWGESARYDKNVSNDFNEAAKNTPVLVADEGITLTTMKAVNTFKELVTRRYTMINEKHKSLYSMDGCPRIMISGNGIDAFQTPEASVEHNDAVAERLLYLECGARKDVEPYLEECDTRGNVWVRRGDKSPGRIAEHILWLNENHVQVSPRGRLLVSGEVDGTWQSQKAATSSGLDGSVLGALAKWADKHLYVDGISVEYDRYPGLLLVNGSALHDVWVELTGDARRPLNKSLSHALASISRWPKPKVVQYQTKKRRCYAVPVESILAAAEVQCIGSDESLMAVLGGGQIQASNRDTENQK